MEFADLGEVLDFLNFMDFEAMLDLFDSTHKLLLLFTEPSPPEHFGSGS